MTLWLALLTALGLGAWAVREMLERRRVQSTLTAAQAEAERWRQAGEAARTEAAAWQARCEAEHRGTAEQETLVRGLAAEILQQKSRDLQELNRTELQKALEPVAKSLEGFQSRVKSLEDDGLVGRTELKKELEHLRALNQQLSQDAAGLVTALRGSAKAQGIWGEVMLDRLLEASGLRADHDYRRQASYTRPDGSRAQPDAVVFLPGGRQLVVDAKISLLAYERYSRAGDEAERERARKEHVASLRAHVRDLASKQYHALPGLQTLDFVLLFVPIEPAFLLALSSDDGLSQEAAEQKVLLVSPTTLLFALRTVASLWRQEQQSQNLQEIVRRGGELYDKLCLFAESMGRVDQSLKAARDNYDEAVKRLSSGKGNVIRQAEMLRDLGLNPAKSLPPAWVEATREDEDDPTGESNRARAGR